MRLAPVTAALLVLAGCGKAASTTESAVCQPACPSGSRCTSDGCVVELDLGAFYSPDLTATQTGCQPACGGVTPHCNPAGAGGRGACVGCLADTDCPTGQLCHTVNSDSAFCVPGCGDDSRCAGGALCCGGMCIDTSSDPINCGTCGTVCASSHAAAACQAGQCASGACASGWADCNNDPGDGCEANVAIDPANCGACGSGCKVPNAIPGCGGGCYVRACNFGFDDCNSEVKDGCETSVLSDVRHCGSCDTSCPGVPNAVVNCQNAACGIASCSNGFGDCDGKVANGCETGLLSNASNCGGCGKKCDQGLICVGGSCTCPQCNNIFPHASAKCVNLQCVFDGCNLGFGDCDGNEQNGCESDVTTDVKNCGACNNVCPNNKPVCINGACTDIDLSGVFNTYKSEGRNVHIWKTPVQCADLAKYTDFCTSRGLSWWRPKSAQDAQTLIGNAFALDNTHTWIQVYGIKTSLGAVEGYNVVTDGGNCVEASPGGDQFGAFRKWACSFCNPPSNAQQRDDNQSCCWDKGHPYDWFVCEE